MAPDRDAFEARETPDSAEDIAVGTRGHAFDHWWVVVVGLSMGVVIGLGFILLLVGPGPVLGS